MSLGSGSRRTLVGIDKQARIVDDMDDRRRITGRESPPHSPMPGGNASPVFLACQGVGPGIRRAGAVMRYKPGLQEPRIQAMWQSELHCRHGPWPGHGRGGWRWPLHSPACRRPVGVGNVFRCRIEKRRALPSAVRGSSWPDPIRRRRAVRVGLGHPRRRAMPGGKHGGPPVAWAL